MLFSYCLIVSFFFGVTASGSMVVLSGVGVGGFLREDDFVPFVSAAVAPRRIFSHGVFFSFPAFFLFGVFFCFVFAFFLRSCALDSCIFLLRIWVQLDLLFVVAVRLEEAAVWMFAVAESVLVPTTKAGAVWMFVVAESAFVPST